MLVYFIIKEEVRCLESILFAFYTFATVLVIIGNEDDEFTD